MSVVVEADAIRLVGRCLVEDAETLLAALQDRPAAEVDIDGVQKLHLAVVQVLLVARPIVRGAPDSSFLARYVVDLLQ